MSLKLNSSGGGSVTLQEPTTSSARTLSLPDVTGTVITTADSGTVTPTMLSQPLTLATAQNTTSGTAIDFTGIPSWVRRITVMLNGVSTNGSSHVIFQLGTSSGLQTTGYATGSTLGAGKVAPSNGFPIFANSAPDVRSGSMVFTVLTGNTWTGSGLFRVNTSGDVAICAGVVALSNTLDRFRMTTEGGTDSFDAGSVNIMYEG